MEQFIALNGTVNTRDLGGFDTRFGGRTRSGRVWRSDLPALISHHDHETFARVGLRHVLDLRTDREHQQRPNPLAADDRYTVHRIDLFAEVMRGLLSGSVVGDPFDLALHYQASFERSRDAYAAIFRTLDDVLSDEPGPVLLHCTVGKDRTGLVAALLLLAAGVRPADVIADYVLSDERIEPLRPRLLREGVALGFSEAAYTHLLAARPETMMRTLAEVDEGLLALAEPAAQHLR